MSKDVIVALDFEDSAQALKLLDVLGDERVFVKVGMELFYAQGLPIVETLKARGHRVFLDLKLHDIPNTVERAMRALTSLGVDMCNVHAAGTIAMMEAARTGAHSGDGEPPLVIAVTQLTSTDEQRMHDELLITGDMNTVVTTYARNALTAGLDGVVCSPLESPSIHETCGQNFLTVTPGVRFPDDDQGDQVRVTTPARARELGSDYIVVGRPITRSADPRAAYRRCVEEFVA